MLRSTLAAVSFVCGLAALPAAEPVPKADSKPQYERMLTGEDAKKFEELIGKATEHQKAGRNDDFLKGLEEGVALRSRVQGADHWETIQWKWIVDRERKIAALPAEKQAGWQKAFADNRRAEDLDDKGRYAEALPLRVAYAKSCRELLGVEHPDTATSYINVAYNLQAQGKTAEAEPLFRKALAINRKVHGEEHPDTATSYNNVAYNLNAQGKAADAEPLLRKALAFRLKVLGEEHPDTATSYNNLATNLDAQGKAAEAEPLHRKALAIDRKVFGDEHRDTATSYNNFALNLQAQGKAAEAELLHRKALAIRVKVLGEQHPDTASSYSGVAFNLGAQGKAADAEPLLRKALAIDRKVLGEEHPDTASSYNSLASNLDAQGKAAEAEPLYRKSLAIYRTVLGEEHPRTAQIYNNIAANLAYQGKRAEAEPLLHKTLAIRLKVLGEEHPDTAASYNDIAGNLNDQGKAAEAEPLFRKALAIRVKVLGEEHPSTAQSYNRFAANLQARGKAAEAELLYRKALAIRVKVLGEEHPDTAQSYNSVAANLQARGKAAEAEPLFRKALAIRVKVLGEEHPDTARSYNNLAANLQARGKAAEAELLYRKALAIRVKVLGEEHPDMARSYNNVASSLDDQGQAAEAELLYRKSLAIRVKVLGEEHPDTAQSYNNVAFNLSAQGKAVEAEPLLRKALAIYRKVLGEEHPDTATSYNNVAGNLDAQGKAAEAAEFLEACKHSYEAARLNIAAQGLDRAEFGVSNSPYPLLAATRAQLMQPEAAWSALEANLARGLLDQLGSAKASRLTADEETRRRELTGQLQAISPRLLKLVSSSKRSDAEQQELDNLLAERSKVSGELAKLAIALSQRELATLPQIQAALAPDSAWISWLDVADHSGKIQEHWVCILRNTGDPHWEKLPAIATDVKWTETDDQPAGLLRNELRKSFPDSAVIADLSRELYAQRLAPAEKHLEGVEHLYVTAVDRMAGIPIDLLTDRYAISYVPSGTFLARLKDQPAPATKGVLALGDPVFRTEPRGKVDPLLVSRGPDLADLPGTRTEVNGLAKLFGNDNVRLLVDSDASEQTLEQLRLQGELSKFRYLHFGTHGLANNTKAFESVLYLAQDKLPKELTSEPNKPFVNGQLSAREVLEYWKLNSELVTLSACETALGKAGGGEGLLGFAQAFLHAGSRSVCLSLWKVDDAATSLLMDRFYRNLLGKRDGLTKPMPKAEALREAKEWLRNLPLDEARTLHGKLKDGMPPRDRGTNAKLDLIEPKVVKSEVPAKQNKPFAHPKYWAAFILIGDPN